MRISFGDVIEGSGSSFEAAMTPAERTRVKDLDAEIAILDLTTDTFTEKKKTSLREFFFGKSKATVARETFERATWDRRIKAGSERFQIYSRQFD